MGQWFMISDRFVPGGCGCSCGGCCISCCCGCSGCCSSSCCVGCSCGCGSICCCSCSCGGSGCCIGCCGCSCCGSGVFWKVMLIRHHRLGFGCIFSVWNVRVVVGLQFRWIIFWKSRNIRDRLKLWRFVGFCRRRGCSCVILIVGFLKRLRCS